jgi:hypothetical protein
LPYGISDSTWKYLPQEDKNAIINAWNAQQGSTTQLPTEVYASPAAQQAEQQYGITPSPSPSGTTYSTITRTTQGTVAPAPAWVFAVNMPSTYPDFAKMKETGQGIVVVADDPNAAALIAAARQWGVPVAIQVNAPPGITPEAFAARVQAAMQLSPDKIVLDVEAAGKGYEGSPGWQFSQQAAALIKPIVGATPIAVTMEPNQDDYNYGAYQGISTSGPTEFWVQTYDANMNPVGTPESVVARVVANGVSPSQVIPVVGPNQNPGTRGLYASFGIPQNQYGGVYGGVTPITTVREAETPGSTVLGQLPSSPPGSSPTTTTGGENWAAAYFGSFGLPPDVVKKVNEIFGKYDDTERAVQFALAYIRGTPWYAETYPGIQFGIAKGIISNEQEYRQYVNAVDVLTRRYQGRNVFGTEVASWLHEGFSPELIGLRFQGSANVATFGQDYRYYLGAFGEGQPSQQEMQALGEQQAGLENPMGLRLKRALDQALTRYQKLFEGQAATPSLSLGKQGLNAPSLLGGRTTPDVGA